MGSVNWQSSKLYRTLTDGLEEGCRVIFWEGKISFSPSYFKGTLSSIKHKCNQTCHCSCSHRGIPLTSDVKCSLTPSILRSPLHHFINKDTETAQGPSCSWLQCPQREIKQYSIKGSIMLRHDNHATNLSL